MRTVNYDARTKNIVGFAVVFLLTSILAGFLISFIWRGDKATQVSAKAASTTLPVVKQNKFQSNLSNLLSRVNDLNALDRHYAHLLLVPAGKEELDSVNKIIERTEKKLRITFDSVSLLRTAQPDSASNVGMNDILSLYGTIIENRKTFNNLRQTIFLDKEVSSSGNEVAQLRELLQQKQDSLNLLLNLVK